MIDMCTAITSNVNILADLSSLLCFSCVRRLFSTEPSTKQLERDAAALIALSDGCLNVFKDFAVQGTRNFSFNTPSASYQPSLLKNL